MGLVGYMKSQETGRISTITTHTNSNGRDVGKKIYRFPKTLTKGGLFKLVVEDCEEHPQGSAVVPVELKEWDEELKSYVHTGRARCCPLCWRILKIDEGDIPPPVNREFVEIDPASFERKRGSPRTRVTAIAMFDFAEKIVQLASRYGNSFDVYDVMAWTSKGRITCLKALTVLQKQGRIRKKSTGGGRGNRSIYEIIDQAP